MLIKALCDYSALQENKTPAGYCKQAIHFEILLTPANSKPPMRIISPSLTPTSTVTIPNYTPVPFLVRSSRKPVSMIK